MPSAVSTASGDQSVEELRRELAEARYAPLVVIDVNVDAHTADNHTLTKSVQVMRARFAKAVRRTSARSVSIGRPLGLNEAKVISARRI
jgi:hypothetical protein